MKKYQSIEQFRNVVKNVRTRHDYKGLDSENKAIYLHDTPYPTLKFEGTIKLHGTNAGIVLYKDGSIAFQSRERVLSLESDNAGFCTYISGVNLNELFKDISFNEYIAIYGEWCGGNIQKGVALNNLDKCFVIFDVIVDGVYLSNYTKSIEVDKIYNINDFPKFEIEINFNNPELSQNKLIEWTLQVEEECPFGKKFGFSGIGEGIVFSFVDDRSIKFKSKGEKHSSSKVTKLNNVDVEKLNTYIEFVEYACTENRLKQGLENVILDVKNTSDFIKWVANDILKEEKDTLIKNNIEWKKVAGMISKKSSEFFRSSL